MLQHSGVPSPAEDSAPTTWEEGGIRVSDQIPLERRGTFPQNYVESNHRREWFQEKFGAETEAENCDETTPVEEIQAGEDSQTSTTTPVQPLEPNSEDEVMSVVVVEEEEGEVGSGEEAPSVNEQRSEETEERRIAETEPEVEVEGAVGGVFVTDSKTDQTQAPFLKQSFDHLNDKVSFLFLYPPDLNVKTPAGHIVLFTWKSAEICQPRLSLSLRDRDLGGSEGTEHKADQGDVGHEQGQFQRLCGEG